MRASTGYFEDTSVIRRVLRERALALSGPRALLMQAAHPLAVAGLLAHSDALEDPYVRLARTAKLMNLITFGPRAEADHATRRVRTLHRAVAGRLPEAVGRYPAGTPYRADDPELLMWILYSLVDSAVVVYRTYVGRLDEAERAALWDDYKVIGRLFGLRARQMPTTVPDLDAYRGPPRPLVETVNFITIALLPDAIRAQYGFFPLPPVAVRKALVGVGAAYVRRGVLPVLPAHIRQVPAARQAA
jgi:uncharacterized protein (DUF2236 family)